MEIYISTRLTVLVGESVVPGSYGQNAGYQRPAQFSDVSIFASAEVLAKYGKYIVIDHIGQDEWYITNSSGIEKDGDMTDDTTSIPISELYFIIPSDIKDWVLNGFKEKGMDNAWLKSHVLVLSDYHSHTYGQMLNDHADALVKNADRIELWLNGRVRESTADIALQLVVEHGQETVYKAIFSPKKNQQEIKQRHRQLQFLIQSNPSYKRFRSCRLSMMEWLLVKGIHCDSTSIMY